MKLSVAFQNEIIFICYKVWHIEGIIIDSQQSLYICRKKVINPSKITKSIKNIIHAFPLIMFHQRWTSSHQNHCLSFLGFQNCKIKMLFLILLMIVQFFAKNTEGKILIANCFACFFLSCHGCSSEVTLI